MKAGENGRGIASRWYPQTLAKRIRAIYENRHRITFIAADAFEIIPDFLQEADAVFFIDPPYTAGGKRAGARLYAYNEVDHEALFAMMASARGEFLMTYDEAPEVEELAARHGFLIRKIPMKNTHHAKLQEFLISPSPGTFSAISSLSAVQTPPKKREPLPLALPLPFPKL